RVFRGIRDGLDQIAAPGGGRADRVPSYGLGRVSRLAFLPGGTGLIASDTSDVSRFGPAKLRALLAIVGGVWASHVGRFDPVELTQLVLRKDPGIPDGIHIQGLAVRPDGGEVLVAFGNRVAFLDPGTRRG